MYAILSEGNLVALCEKPRYIKVSETSGAYVESSKDEAIGIAVNGTVYNLPGGTAIEDAPEAVVKQEEAKEYIFANKVQIKEDAETNSAAIISVEDAVCDLDETTDNRITQIETAICELDEQLNA